MEKMTAMEKARVILELALFGHHVMDVGVDDVTRGRVALGIVRLMERVAMDETEVRKVEAGGN